MSKGDHPQLAGLKALWDIPDSTLNRILWAETNREDGIQEAIAIGIASMYIGYMEAYEFTGPEEAWPEWCHYMDIVHEIDNNPYTS